MLNDEKKITFQSTHEMTVRSYVSLCTISVLGTCQVTSVGSFAAVHYPMSEKIKISN